VVASVDIVRKRRHRSPAEGARPRRPAITALAPLPPDTSLNPCTLSLLDAVPGCIVLAATVDGELLYLNAEGRKLLYGDAATPVPLRLDQLFAPPTRQSLVDTVVPECLRSGSWRGETKLLGRDGQEIPVMQAFVANRIRHPHREVTVLAGVAWDLRQQKAAEQRLRSQAMRDALTDCANRSLLMEHLTQATHRAERQRGMFGVVFLDLDDFKQINDTFGHEQANAVLRQLGARLRSQIRGEDTVARYGGDEFALLISDLGGPHDVERVKRKIAEIFTEPFVVGSTRVHATASVGVAIYPLDGEDPEALLRAADAKMYRAKRGAKRRGGESESWLPLVPAIPPCGVDAVARSGNAAG
jgi:diguanylate cyclase (GGDEF)-like protein